MNALTDSAQYNLWAHFRCNKNSQANPPESYESIINQSSNFKNILTNKWKNDWITQWKIKFTKLECSAEKFEKAFSLIAQQEDLVNGLSWRPIIYGNKMQRWLHALKALPGICWDNFYSQKRLFTNKEQLMKLCVDSARPISDNRRIQAAFDF